LLALVAAIGMIIVFDLFLLISWAVDKAIVMALYGEDNLPFKTLKKIMIISNVAILIAGLLYVIGIF